MLPSFIFFLILQALQYCRFSQKAWDGKSKGCGLTARA
jgi:hypothetical protein